MRDEAGLEDGRMDCMSHYCTGMWKVIQIDYSNLTFNEKQSMAFPPSSHISKWILSSQDIKYYNHHGTTSFAFKSLRIIQMHFGLVFSKTIKYKYRSWQEVND